MSSPQSHPHAPLRALTRTLRAIPYAELSTALAATVGFFLLVWAGAALLTPWAWAIGGGVYLISLAGFRLVGVMCWRGLYELSQPEDEE